jgi:hypothetical protein
MTTCRSSLRDDYFFYLCLMSFCLVRDIWDSSLRLSMRGNRLKRQFSEPGLKFFLLGHFDVDYDNYDDLISTLQNGFIVKNINEIDQSYICPSCKLVLREPYQLNCRHRQCQSCINTQDK